MRPFLPRLPLCLAVVIHTVLGLDLVFASVRYSKTPAYGILIDIFNAPTWGFLYLGVALVLAICFFLPTFKPLVIVSHAISIALLGFWWIAFIARRISDDKTTIVNVNSWFVYLCITLGSLFVIARSVLIFPNLGPRPSAIDRSRESDTVITTETVLPAETTLARETKLTE